FQRQAGGHLPHQLAGELTAAMQLPVTGNDLAAHSGTTPLKSGRRIAHYRQPQDKRRTTRDKPDIPGSAGRWPATATMTGQVGATSPTLHAFDIKRRGRSPDLRMARSA